MLPCGRPHDFEAYLVFDLQGEQFPGQDQVATSASTRCLAEFKPFVGVAYPKSVLEPYALYPSECSWDLFDDRAVVCLIGEPGTKSTGTLAGSRR